MKLRIVPSKLAERQMWGTPWVLTFTIMLLALAFETPARSQEPSPSAQSIAEAARNAREQQSNSTKRPKIITDDDLGMQPSLPRPSAIPQESSSKNEAEAPTPEKADCNDPEAKRLTMDLQAAQEERDQILRDLAYQPKVISDGDVDMKNFKPSSSGVDIGSPPLSQTQPQAPARVAEVMLDEKIASLKDALRIACGSPEDAGTQRELDWADRQLKLLQQEFVLDQAAYYSKPNYSEDTAGKDRLNAEQQQIEYLQAEIERLKDKLAVRRRQIK